MDIENRLYIAIEYNMKLSGPDGYYQPKIIK